MVNVFSKFPPVYVACKEVHPFEDDCLIFITDFFIHTYYTTFSMYCYVYLVPLLLHGEIPKLKDFKNTFFKIMQSAGYLSGFILGYTTLQCVLRRIVGSYNILSLSFLPAFISSGVSLFIERPSRRPLIGLFLCNVTTETIWNMLAARGIVTPIKYAQVAVFGISISLLLTFLRAGLCHKKESDPIIKLLRFIIGPSREQCDSASNSNILYKQEKRIHNSWTSIFQKKDRTLRIHLIHRILKVYTEIINRIKGYGRYLVCPHPFSCIYYILEGTVKAFSLGLGIQITLKLLLNIQKLIKSPKEIGNLLFKMNILRIANFLGASCSIFRAMSCLLRRCTGKDSPLYSLPAGLLAGIAFSQYENTTIALYVFWKTAQIAYNLGIEKGYVPEVPGANLLLCSLLPGILFHVAILEPQNLQPGYWKFLVNNTGGRFACFNRKPFDVWGLGSSQGLAVTLLRTKTKDDLQFLGRKV